MRIYRNILLLALALVSSVTLRASAATVTATLDPAQISLGDSAQLTVTVSGSQDQPTIPKVDGLDIQSVGTSTQVEIINGSVTANASSTFAVTPEREGTFVIPAIQAGGASSQPVSLTVGKGSSATPPPTPSASAPSSGPVVLPPVASGSSPDETSASPGRYGSIQITLPKEELYVGELVPVDIRAIIPEDLQASISDLPQFTSDGFTLDSLSTKPDQTVEDINGRAYNVLTWHTALSGVKAGDYPLTLQMPLTVIVPRQMPQGDDDDMFNNFFRNTFANMGTKKEVTISTPARTIKVLPLPLADRPTGFSGAVGRFDVDASASPTSVNAGDPITLRLKVSGTGNFDRVSSDMLASDPHWKTYSPKSHFDAQDSVGFRGTKTFEQPVIPNDSSISSIPSLSFSYFDPETRQYVTRTTAPVPVTVQGGATNSAPPSTMAATAPTASTTPPAISPPSDDLRANMIEPGTFVSTLRPIYLNPWFLAGQGVPLLALLGGLAFRRRQERISQPQRVRAAAAQEAIRQQIAAMDEAMSAHQTGAFFVHARGALQQRLGHDWNMRPETITLADIESKSDTNENVRSIFTMADQASYSDLHFAESDLREWRQVVVNETGEKN